VHTILLLWKSYGLSVPIHLKSGSPYIIVYGDAGSPVTSEVLSFRLVHCVVQMVTRTKKLFVGGLSASTTIEDVRSYFEQFGKVYRTPPSFTYLLSYQVWVARGTFFKSGHWSLVKNRIVKSSRKWSEARLISVYRTSLICHNVNRFHLELLPFLILRSYFHWRSEKFWSRAQTESCRILR